MNSQDPQKTAESIRETGEILNQKQYELNRINRGIEVHRHEADKQVVFNSELKNSEQRNYQRKEIQQTNEELQSLILQAADLYKEIKDLEVKLEYYRNLFKIQQKEEHV